MSGMQFNYFASGDDLLLVAQTIYAWSPGLYLFPERGSEGQLKGVAVTSPAYLIPKRNGEIHLLCPSDLSALVATTPIGGDLSCVRIQENPVVEYSPSAPINTDTVKIGRLFVAYNEGEFRRSVRSLFNALKSRGARLQDGDVWIFPHARATASTLRPWIGKDWINTAASG